MLYKYLSEIALIYLHELEFFISRWNELQVHNMADNLYCITVKCLAMQPCLSHLQVAEAKHMCYSSGVIVGSDSRVNFCQVFAFISVL